MKLSVLGTGPGSGDYLLPIAERVLREADEVIGYQYYLQFVRHLLKPGCVVTGNSMMEEEERARLAVAACAPGKHVVVVSSGDPSVYAMASLVYEHVSTLGEAGEAIRLQTIPGLSAFSAAGSRLGAVLGHDFCCISLSDLMTPWSVIEKRIRAAAAGDFVTSLYNPRSQKRRWQIERFRELFLEERRPDTPVAIVRQVGRPDESVLLGTLGTLDTEAIDMFCVVVVGNSETFRYRDHLITPRGFLNRKPETGAEIQGASFGHIEERLTREDLQGADRAAVVRCIHTTADFEYERLYWSEGEAVERWGAYLRSGGVVVSDVTMVQAGVSKEFVRRHGIRLVCLLNEPEVAVLAQREKLTRSQAAMRLAIERHPEALFAIGNAPTALFEVLDAVEEGRARPVGIIGAPVGFVNVIESKLRLRHSASVPRVIIQGNKGGSGVAAAILNAACSWQADTTPAA